MCSSHVQGRQRTGRGSRCERDAQLRRRRHEPHSMRWVARSVGHLHVSTFSPPRRAVQTEDSLEEKVATKRRKATPACPPNPHLYSAHLLLGSALTVHLACRGTTDTMWAALPLRVWEKPQKSAQSVYPGFWCVLRDTQHVQRGMRACPDTSQE